MRIVIASDTQAARDLFRQAALGATLDCGTEDCVLLDELQGRLAQGPHDLLLVIPGDNLAAGVEAIRLASAHTNEPVLAAGPANEPKYIIEVLRAGARDFLDQSHPREELGRAVGNLRLPTAGEEKRNGRLIAVTGASTGCGVTTVASGLAFALAGQNVGQVSLAELGQGIPDLSLNLDLEPLHSVADLGRDWKRMDATLLKSAMVAHPAGVQVLTYSPETLTSASLEAPALRQMLLLLRSIRGVAVLDLGHVPQGHFLDALHLADAIVIVTRLDVPGLRLTRKFLQGLIETDVDQDKICLVGNRYGQRRQLAWRRAEEAIGFNVRAWLPDDAASLNEALNHGQPLIQAAPRAVLTKRLAQLARELTGKQAPARTTP
jgi:pilus assembly protein CpaE